MTAAQDITRHFGGDWHGSHGAFPTPGHGKSDRGTTVKDTADGDVVFYSHNGGEWQAVKDECRRLGLLPERKRGGASDVWREMGRYEYVDADGSVVYRTIRKEKPGERKRFVAQRPDGRGGWINGLDKETPRVLYRLPQILAADRASVVFLTEGERKADKLAAWGLVATAIAFGAKGWRDTYAKALNDRTVVILPDNGDEGRGFAERASKSLASAGARVFVLSLPDLPPKGDIIDWKGTPEELRVLTEAAINPQLPMLPVLDPGAWQGKPAPSRTWALHEWIPTKQATYLTGAGSTGKSLFAQQLATCIALGHPFLGVETRQAVAIYMTCEDDEDELHRRQLAICAALNVQPRILSGKLHLVSLAGAIGNELATFDPQGRMATTQAWATLHATVMQTGAGFVALDNVAHLFAGNENIRNQVAAFCSLLNGLAADASASVLFLGHPNKAGDSFSGSTSWENQVRSRLFLDWPRDGDGDTPDPDERQLSRAKANYARNGEMLTFRWHQWAFMRDGDLPTKLYAEMRCNAQANTENERFLKCLAKATEERRNTSPNRNASNYAPRLFASMPLGKGVDVKGFEAAMQRLFHLGRIENDKPLWQRDNRAWVTGIRLAPTRAQTVHEPGAQSCTNHPPSQQETCTNLHAAAPSPILRIGDNGAAWPAATPFDDADIDWGNGT